MAITCSQFDLLEIAAMRKQAVEVTFADQSIQVEIADLYAREGKDYLKDKNGNEYCLADAMDVKLVK